MKTRSFARAAARARGARLSDRRRAISPAAGDGAAQGFGIEHLSRLEGWYQNADGTYTLLIGYYNRNKKQTLDIPIGPENRIEPGGPDQGQPTHFVVGRGWGTIAIKVPKDFGDKKLTWTLTANGKTVRGSVRRHQGLSDRALPRCGDGQQAAGDQVQSENGPALTGPPPPLSQAHVINGAVGENVAIKFWITDDGHEEPPTGGAAAAPPPGGGAPQGPPRRPRVSTTLTKYRGPGEIKFADNTPTIEKDVVNTTATFSLPGEYVIRVEGNDSSGVGGGGFQCCWTTAYFKVNVKAANTGG